MGRAADEGTLGTIWVGLEEIIKLAKECVTGCGVPGPEGILGGLVAIIDMVKVRNLGIQCVG